MTESEAFIEAIGRVLHMGANNRDDDPNRPRADRELSNWAQDVIIAELRTRRDHLQAEVRLEALRNAKPTGKLKVGS